MEQVIPMTGEATEKETPTISLQKGEKPSYLTKDSTINGVAVNVRDFAYVSDKGVYFKKNPKAEILEKYHLDAETYDTYAGLVLQVAFS